MLRALDRKMLRDLWQMRGPAIAITAVMACGIATFVMSLSTLESLQQTQSTYYERYRFAQVFAHLTRAPSSLADRINAIPGVGHVQTRIVKDVTLDVPGLAEPATGRLISIPDRPTPSLNDIYLRTGRYPDPARSGEALVGEMFAHAHDMKLGDHVTAIINGKKERLTIVGIGLSPEYVLQIKPGELLPDEKRFGIFWMCQSHLAAAFDMDGAFNDVTLSMMRGAQEAEVIRRLDDLLNRYGGIGAHGRTEQMSHRYLSDEIRQLRSMARVAPTIFLSVAAFLLNVVLSRLIKTQREQIAALKAFGYSRWEVGKHFFKLVFVIVVLGTIVGTMVGGWFGHNLTQMYTRFYKFPIFQYQLDRTIILGGAIIGLLSAFIGVQGAVRGAMALPPAEAMRPEPPANYRPTWVERMGLGFLFSPVGRMVMRNVERQPLKSAMSSLGIAMAVAVLILGTFTQDALNYLIDFQFRQAQRQDVMIAFVEPTSQGVFRELEKLPGVLQVEFFRSVSTRLRFAHRDRRIGVMALDENPTLFRLLDAQEEPVEIPSSGIMLSTKLAELLGVRLGDTVEMEVLEGERGSFQIPVTGLVTEFGGLNAYMTRPTLHRWLQEERRVSGAFLKVTEANSAELYRLLKQTPKVASVNVKQAALQSFHETIAENLNNLRMFNIIFASIIAVGVVYNSARISLAERSRELATLRVIGFSRLEVSTILIGELSLLTIVACPVGMLIGYGMSWWASLGLDTEVYRIPLVVEAKTYAMAIGVVLAAAVGSALSVHRGLGKLDLVAVLKSRE